MMAIIEQDRSLIIACDVNLGTFERLVSYTHRLDCVGGYKIPATAGRDGWETWVDKARMYTGKPLIHDGQKWGNDIPKICRQQAKALKEAGFDAFIMFPHGGPETQVAMIEEARDIGIDVIVGGHMTHDRYVESEGGYIANEAIPKIYQYAAQMGVSDFVVPGNKPEIITRIKGWLEAVQEDLRQQGDLEFELKPLTFFAPGFVTQGGDISEGGKAAGERFHAICGSGVYGSHNFEEAAKTLGKQL